MIELSKASEAKSYLKSIINHVQGKKIKQIFSLSPFWNNHCGYRLYSDCAPLYIVFETGQCLIIEYNFVDALRAECREMNEEEINNSQNLPLTDYFNSSDDIYNSVNGKITDVDRRETIALEYSELESIELRKVTWEYSKWIDGDIDYVLPTEETFDQIKFVMSNGNSFIVCADDAEMDGYIMAWSTDSDENVVYYN